VQREYLWNGAEIPGSQIIIGNLFYQSFLAQFNTLTGAYYLTPSTWVQGTQFEGYLGQSFQTSQNNKTSPSFEVQPVVMEPGSGYSMDG
jgi:hypothetical protein